MSWNDVGTTSNGGTSNKPERKYLKIPTGTTTIRVIDEAPEVRWTHWIPEANEGKGFNANCPGKGCPICKEIAEKKKAKQKCKYSSRKLHAINVLNRADNEVYILDQGVKIFNGLKTLMAEMGDLREYDVKIVKTGESFGNIDYQVFPVFPPEELSSELKEKAENDKFDLKEYTKPVTVEEIVKLQQGASLESVFGNSNTDEEEAVDFTA